MRRATLAACLRLAAALVAVLVSSLVNLTPLTMRPDPTQKIFLSNSTTLLVPALVHADPFIPDAEAACPSFALYVLVIVGWVLTMASNRDSLPASLDAAAVYAVAQALNCALTISYKRYCGFLRPNYLEGCGWSPSEQRCTQEYLEGRVSFPSGHASSSAAGATVLTLFVLRLLDRWASQASRSNIDEWAERVLRCAAPLPAAVVGWVAASRVHDHWHHPADVAAGALLGVACAALVFRLAVAPTFARTSPLLMGHEQTQCESAHAAANFAAANFAADIELPESGPPSPSRGGMRTPEI